MGEGIWQTFGDIEIEKNKLYRHRSPVLLRDVDIEKILLSNKVSSGERNYEYFILVTCIMIISHYI